MEEADIISQSPEVQEEQVASSSHESESQATGNQHEDKLDEDPQGTDNLDSGTGEVKKEVDPSTGERLEASIAPPSENPVLPGEPELEEERIERCSEEERKESAPPIRKTILSRSPEEPSSTGNQHEDRPIDDPQGTDKLEQGTDNQDNGTGEGQNGGVEEEWTGVEELPVKDKTLNQQITENVGRHSAKEGGGENQDEEQEEQPGLDCVDSDVKSITREPFKRITREPSSNGSTWMFFGVLGLLLAFLVSSLFSQPPPEQVEVPRVDIFLKEMERTKARFPSQRPELWRRSRIHLERHLQTAQPTEPVSLILTAGRRAEKTLHCLAQNLAFAFSSALNASVLHIDGASKAGQDSNQVKLDIDDQLRGAFGGDKPVAVIHRFEELPPSSTIIFYRYCDHENAAYKQASLIFTVLLAGEEEVPTHVGLNAVEEMVDDHLQAKFLSSGHSAAFDRMDLDKFSGLWSRISHLILPVAAEERIEQQGCGGTSTT